MSSTQYMRTYRAKNRDKFREYNRVYNMMWRYENGYHNEIKSMEKYPEKEKARRMLRREIRLGNIKRGNCEVCNEPNGQAHHDSYEAGQELNVKWFCPLHHKEYEMKKFSPQSTEISPKWS